jgi:hypothetical protein
MMQLDFADPRDLDTPRTFSSSHFDGLQRIGVLLRLLVCCALTNAYVVVASCVATAVYRHGCAANHTLPIGVAAALVVVRILDVPRDNNNNNNNNDDNTRVALAPTWYLDNRPTWYLDNR